MPAAPSGNLGGFALGDFPVPLVHATHRIIRDCNAEFAELFGYERDELIEFSFSALYPKLADFVHTGQMWRVKFCRRPALCRRAHHAAPRRKPFLVPGQRAEPQPDRPVWRGDILL